MQSFFDKAKKFHRRAINAERAIEGVKLKIRDEVDKYFINKIFKNFSFMFMMTHFIYLLKILSY